EKSGSFLQTSAPVLWGDQRKFVGVFGTNEHFEDLRSWRVAQGRFFTRAEVEQKAPVAVVGQGLREAMVGPDGDPVGMKLRFQNQELEVVGVLERNTLSIGVDINTILLIPNTLMADVLDMQKPSTILLRFRSPDEVARYKPEVERILTERHGVKDFTVMDQQQMLRSFSTILDNVTLFIGAVAAIALVVGGIGIMNIMLVSVKERTREIGIRKAIGARRRDILLQFLVEASLLSLTGGAVGIVLGNGMALAAARALGWSFAPSLPAVLVSSLFAAAVGIFFGFYPAWSASRLPAVEALRYE
ncbi:MAG: FtsX-like permease family protein, partial [Armatimonadota bacterium]|nr:FtsX-like permease family protein [Armatimonadota bacterium]